MDFERAYKTLLAVEAREPDPWNLMGYEPFTMRELLEMHRSLGCAMERDTFRRRILRSGMLKVVGDTILTGGRPAVLYVKTSTYAEKGLS